jgi:HD superfamily phosphohydrolase
VADETMPEEEQQPELLGVSIAELSGQLPLLEEAEATSFDDVADQEFLLPVSQFVEYTAAEVEIIDHPAFQRLFEIQQLGQTNLVFRGATHKRGEHALGAVSVIANFITPINRASTRAGTGNGWTIASGLSSEEIAFARLSALLHDIGHIVAGHTLEDELGLLEAHDADDRLLLVLDRGEWGGRLIVDGGPIGETLRQRIDRLYATHANAANLRDGEGSPLSPSEIVLAVISKDPHPIETNQNFRLNVLRDLVGNTICADLLDYLHRDWHHIGKPRFFDVRLLQYMELRERGSETFVAVNLQSNKPGRYRPDAVTAILDLLESRYQLWEVVLLHRTKTAASAMLERALAELAEGVGYFTGDSTIVAKVLLEALFEAGDSEAYTKLATLTDDPRVRALLVDGASVPEISKDLLWRVRYRVLHKQVAIVGGQDSVHDQAISKRLAPNKASTAERLEAAKARLLSLRELELDFGLASGSLAMYTAPYGMGRKLADVRVLYNNDVQPLHAADAGGALTGGHLEAQLQRFDRLWRATLFASPEAMQQLEEQDLQDVLDLAFRIGVLGIEDSSVSMRNVAESLAVRQQSPFAGRELRDSPMLSAQSGAAAAYPSGAPTARAYFR